LTTEDEEAGRPFPFPLPLDPNTRTLASIPLVLFYPGVLALAAAAGLAGSTVGRGLPGERAGRCCAVAAALCAGAPGAAERR
jgi:hypothetical protein